MESINNNKERNGNFTSSEIVALLSMGTREMTELEISEHKKKNPKSRKTTIESWPGAAALTYIRECNFERKLGRSITADIDARPTSWGSLCESFVFDNKLGHEYILCSNVTMSHPHIKWWKGSPDALKKEPKKIVSDVKCPQTLKSFTTLIEPSFHGLIGKEWIDALRFGFKGNDGLDYPKHPDGEKYYWQLVSNAIISESTHAELIVYCPFEEDLDAIRLLAQEKGDGQFMWISFASNDQLPFILKSGLYNDINIIEFEVPKEDTELLTLRVNQGGRMLIDTSHGEEG